MSATYQLQTNAASQLIKLYAEAATLYRRALRDRSLPEDLIRNKAVFFHMRQVIAACFLGDADLDELDDDLGIDDDLLAFYATTYQVSEMPEVRKTVH